MAPHHGTRVIATWRCVYSTVIHFLVRVRVIVVSRSTKMAANDMSIKQPMEAFIKHVDELRQTDENEVDGYDKEFRVNIIVVLFPSECSHSELRSDNLI